MFRKSKIKVGTLPNDAVVDMSKTETFHSLSYYLNGGIDLTGEALDKSADVEFDTDEQLAELDAEGAMSVPYGDPRMSKFRLVENYGQVEAKKISSKSSNATASSSVEATTTTE